MEFNYEGNSLKSGIYKITNKVNNKIYIGSAKRFKERARDHLRSLKRQKHHNKYLQRSFNEHGSDAFIFEVLEVTDRKTTLQRRKVEQKYLDEQISLGNWDNCYNFAKKTVRKQGPWSYTPEETRKKLSLAGIGKKRSEGTKKLLSKQKLGSKNPMAGKIPWNKSKKMSVEFCQKISESQKGDRKSVV